MGWPTPFPFLPRRGDGEAWLYLVGLMDGRIKVGRTAQPRARLQQHLRAFGDNFAWFVLGPSCRRMGMWYVERQAIADLARIGQQIDGTEVFSGISSAAALKVLHGAITRFSRVSGQQIRRMEEAEAAKAARTANAPRRADRQRSSTG